MLEPVSSAPPMDDQTAQLKRIGDELRELRWQHQAAAKRRTGAVSIGVGIWLGWVLISLTIAAMWATGLLAIILAIFVAAAACPV